MIDWKKLALIIKIQVTAMEMGRNEFAEYCGIGNSTLCRVCKGKMISADNLMRIVHKTGIKIPLKGTPNDE